MIKEKIFYFCRINKFYALMQSINPCVHHWYKLILDSDWYKKSIWKFIILGWINLHFSRYISLKYASLFYKYPATLSLILFLSSVTHALHRKNNPRATQVCYSKEYLVILYIRVYSNKIFNIFFTWKIFWFKHRFRFDFHQED